MALIRAVRHLAVTSVHFEVLGPGPSLALQPTVSQKALEP